MPSGPLYHGSMSAGRMWRRNELYTIGEMLCIQFWRPGSRHICMENDPQLVVRPACPKTELKTGKKRLGITSDSLEITIALSITIIKHNA